LAGEEEENPSQHEETVAADTVLRGKFNAVGQMGSAR